MICFWFNNLINTYYLSTNNIYVDIQQGLTQKELNENPKFVQVDLKNGKFNFCQILHVDLVSEFQVIYGVIFLNEC